MTACLKTKNSPLPSSQVKPLGELAERLNRAAARLAWDDVYRPEWLLSDITFACDPTPFHDWYTGREWTWYADVSGRYLNAMASVAPFIGGIPDKGREIADLVFKTQAADGHFGTDRPLDACDRAQASGTAWMLLALPRYYTLTGDKRALQAARRLAGWYAAVTPFWLRPDIRNEQFDKGDYGLLFSNFTHCLGGLATLYEVDPQPAYADLALRIARSVKSFDTEIQSHHFISTLRGLLHWYEITGEPFLLEKVLSEYKQIKSVGLLDTAGVAEVFDTPVKSGGAAAPHSSGGKTDEGCSEVDWVLINLKLHLVTGDHAYLETAERAIFSHFFMNQAAMGGFGTWFGFHVPVGPMPAGAIGRYGEAYWCCSMHGTHGLTEIARHVYTVATDGIHVNLFLGCDAQIPRDGGTVRLHQTGMGYPLTGEVDLAVELSGVAATTLHIHLPRHSPLGSVVLDDRPMALPAKSSDTLPVAVKGEGRHTLRLTFDLSLRCEPTLRPDVFGAKHSLWYGPMALGTNANPATVSYRTDAAMLAGIKPKACSRKGAFPSEMEFHIPATDAPGFAHTRDRHHVVFYPLAACGFRKLSYLQYLFQS
ncbi:MAG: glycoside hydrolase family 127 protein [Kiritimatiellaeota bacterium]|nr:glycoside hydrolase family 127 protein [Kiritimatiellota bacterium]